jgi:hypothetical protein
MTDPVWLQWAKRLQAAAQNGLAYNDDPFNRERYEAINRIAAEMMAAGAGAEEDMILDLFAGQIHYAHVVFSIAVSVVPISRRASRETASVGG